MSIHSTSALAKQLGLSRWTVSRALNGHSGIRTETAERVRAAAKDMGFSPSVLGRGLRTGRTDLVGVCVPDLEDYFLTSKISRLQHAVQEKGLHAMIHITDGTAVGERWALKRFASMHCSAVILIASGLPPNDSAFHGLAVGAVTVISVDPRHKGHQIEVSTDRAHAMREAVKWLDQAGHRELVTAGIDPTSAYGRQRIAGIERGCKACGWNYHEAVTHLADDENCDDFAAGTKIAAHYLERYQNVHPPIIALNDRVALAMMLGLRRAGLRVPEDVSVIGYDNAEFSAYSEPPLTTIDPQVNELIRTTVKFLSPLEDDHPHPAKRKMMLKPKLILRGSTCAHRTVSLSPP